MQPFSTPGASRFVSSVLRTSGRRVIRSGIALVPILFALLPAVKAEPKKEIERAPFMWKAESGRSTVYMLGSVHVARRDMYPLPAAVERAFRRSDVVVGELNLSKLNPLDLIGEMTRQGSYPEGETLAENLSPKTLELLKERLEAEGMTMDEVSGYRPWMVNTILVMRRATRAGFDPNLSIDMHYLQRAAAAGKRVAGLETPQQQFEAIASGGKEVQDLALRESLMQLDKFDGMMEALVKAWMRGDPEALEASVKTHSLEDPRLDPYHKALIADRNKGMAEKILAHLKTGKTTFVIVGSYHLVGDDSIQALLEKEGVEVVKVEGPGD